MAASSGADRGTGYRLSRPVHLSESEEGDSMPSPQEDADQEPYQAALRQVTLHRATLCCPVATHRRGGEMQMAAGEGGHGEPPRGQQQAAAPGPLPGAAQELQGKGERAAEDTAAEELGAPVESRKPPQLDPQGDVRQAQGAEGGGSTDPHRPEGEQGSSLTGLKIPLHDAWTGLRSNVGAERDWALEITERLLGSEESRSQAGEPPAWVSLSSVAILLGDVERQLGWRVGSQDAPMLMALDSVEAREAGKRREPRERLGSEQ
ncbi:UNVERIFIED_CONTAM: hypothetical protein K2H54_054310 [Gekko kuhli]